MVYQNVTYKFVTDALICHLTSTPFPCVLYNTG